MRPIIVSVCRIFPALLLPALLVSCQPAKHQNGGQDEIHLALDPANLPKMAKLSGVVDGVRLIPLETGNLNLIGHINKVIAGKDFLLISTAEEIPQLFRFTTTGKFLNIIGSQGKGPGEYSDIANITVLPDSSSVYIQGRSMRKILEYSLNGQFIREIPFGKGLYNAAFLDQNRIAFTSFGDHEVLIINSLTGDTLKYIKTTPDQESQIRGFAGDPSMGFFYSALGRDTIWDIGKESMEPKIICDFGSGHFSSRDYINSLGNPGGYPPGKLSIGGGVMYSSGYYLFALLREDDTKEYTYCRVLVDERTVESWHLDQSPASDDVLFCTSTDFRTVASSGEWVSVVGADELIDALPKIRENSAFKYPPELIGQIEKMTIEDNPVLVLYSLR